MIAKKQELGCDYVGMHKHIGISAIILGILVLLNFYYLSLDWAVFWGIILILIGIKKLFLFKK